MPASLSPSTHLFGGSQKVKRPRAFSVTVCGKDRKISFSNDGGTLDSVGDSSNSKAGNALESEKSRYLKKGTVLVEENADGSVLFQFEPNSRVSQSRNMPAVVTPGKQRKSLAKLQRIASGESDPSQLKYPLWQSHVTSPADRTSSAAQQSTDAQPDTHVTDGSSAGPDRAEQNNEANGGAKGQQQFMSRNGHSRQSLSLLLGEDRSSLLSDRQQQSEPARQYAFSSTRESPDTQSQRTLHQTPALLQRPKRPPAPEPGSSTLLGQDTAYSTSWADRKDERKVPCYLWHESGLPKRVNLRDFPTQTSDEADEAVSSSDTPSTIADSGAAFSQDGSCSAASPSAAGRAIHKAWEPVRQVLLRVWRLLPYWFRKTLMRSQQQHVPPVHASKVLAQHAMSYHEREPVEGSTYDLTTGRSPTPLIDLERYQIEMLVNMGISDVELYRVALTSPSAVSTNQIVASSFDRLEFLGDSVVGLVFRSWVYNRFPKDDEGSMTNTANTLVSNRAHVQYANQLHLTSYIAQNLKYLRPTARVDEDIIADAFEALVGAIYLDRGLQAASTFVITLAEEVMGLERDLSSYRNYKLYLVNNVNYADLGRVSYVSKKRGNLWQSKVRLQGKLLGIGLDKQRKQAESAAAYAAMEILGFEDYGVEPVGLRSSPGPLASRAGTQSSLSPGQAPSPSPNAPPQTASRHQISKKM